MNRRLYRSRSDRMVRGVCAGLADYFGLDVSLVRIAFVVLTILSVGHAVIAYLLLSVLLPEQPVEGVRV